MASLRTSLHILRIVGRDMVLPFFKLPYLMRGLSGATKLCCLLAAKTRLLYGFTNQRGLIQMENKLSLPSPRSNLTLNLAPFSRWTLRDKAAQRRLGLR